MERLVISAVVQVAALKGCGLFVWPCGALGVVLRLVLCDGMQQRSALPRLAQHLKSATDWLTQLTAAGLCGCLNVICFTLRCPNSVSCL